MNPTGSTIGSLLTELREEGTTLIRQEVALAKAELSEKISQAIRNSLGAAVGGAVAYAGAIVLLIGVGLAASQALVSLGVNSQTAQWLGFMLVGAIVALIGWAMLARAKKSLKADALAPHETIESLRESQRWAQDKIHSIPSST